MEPEWGRVMTVAARENSTVSSILRQFWDSGANRSLKVGKPYSCTNAHLSIIGHVTDAEIASRLTTAEKYNGGANRFLWVKVRRTKSLPFGGDPWPPALDELVDQLRYAAQTAKATGEMGLEDAAKLAWPGMYSRLTQPRPGEAGVMLARGTPIVRRLACIYALADDRVQVRLADLEAAMALWEYAARSVCSIFGSSTGNKDADRLLEALVTQPKGLTRTQITAEVFNRNLTKGRINAALALLRDNHYAHGVRFDTNGGPVERWYAGPWQATN